MKKGRKPHFEERRTSLAVYVPLSLAATVKASAESRGLNVSNFLRALIERHYEEEAAQ